MTAPHPTVLLTFARYAIHSTLEGPLIVETNSLERALFIGLQLLERDHRIEELSFERGADGTLFAKDVSAEEHFAVRALAA